MNGRRILLGLMTLLILSSSIVSSTAYCDAAGDNFRQGVNLMDSQEYHQAITEFNKVLGYYPDDFQTLENIGLCYTFLDEHQQAIWYFNKSAKSNPQNIHAFLDLGASYISLEQYDKSIENSQKALRLDPKSALAYYNIGVAYVQQDQFDEAIEYIEKAKKLYKDQGNSSQASRMEEVLNELYSF
ncbi:tetratricopeptide repeat protein [Candidatus Omnitrophota bacterium]